MLLSLMEQAGVGPGRTLMIGDTTHDLELARNAGVSAVAVAYGAHPPAGLAGMSAACHRAFDRTELRRWLTQNA